MNMRFSTVAANADILGEETPNTSGAPGAAPEKPSRPAAARKPRRPAARAQAEGKSGKNINDAGFVKAPDAGKP